MREQASTLTASGPAPPGAASIRGERILLRDGTPAELVELGAEDEADVLALHRRLGERDTYLRFATLHPAGLERYVRRTLSPASGNHTWGARVDGRLVGVAQLLPCGAGVADVAVVVEAAARHEGVASALLGCLAAIAEHLGIDRLVAEVLAENGPMLRVLTDLGMPMRTTREGAALRIEVDLAPGRPVPAGIRRV